MPTRTDRVLQPLYRSFERNFPWIPLHDSGDASLRVWVNNQRITSANHPKWAARMKAGLDVTTTLYGTRYYWKPAQGHVKVYYSNSGLQGFQSLVGQTGGGNIPSNPGVVDSSLVAKVTSLAEIAFAKNYRKKTQNWSSGVFCGELLEVGRMLANPAKGIRQGIDVLYDTMKRHVRNAGSDPRAARRASRAIAGSWLEWKFGVMPLIQDADDAAEAFRAMASGRQFDQVRITGTASSGSTPANLTAGTQSWNPNQAGFPSGSFLKVAMDYTDEVEVTLRGAWRNGNPSGEMPLPMRFGLGVNDILPTAWELIPWSFFVDYFVNVGDVLDAWGMRFVNFSWLNRTTRSCRTARMSDLIASNVPPFNALGSYGGHVVSKRFEVNRVPTSNAFDTGFHVKIPGFASAGKWLNINALLAMRIKP